MFALYHATKTGKKSIPEEELQENDKGCKSFWGPPIIHVTITQACTLDTSFGVLQDEIKV